MNSIHTMTPDSNGRSYIWLECLKQTMIPDETCVPMCSFCLYINVNTHPPQGLSPLEGVHLAESPSLALSSAHAVPEGIITSQGFTGILGHSIAAIHAFYF